ncbi:haloacid dehalogenase type II [Roseomonas alkaliterrae]|uniref:2-haloacid dehalogenase n=1 Tax=Neoroseomonas alkaliterrae TaxID=1452450 RepID=A0A840XS42_9PROT|nr:haloacid dehalogenase type II [Neoroseomonas alkaliterrae]MBB5689770.1 2-haloacid dehalogenase [Neoroseomonas alkaliterrae]MBR0674914.1 haloacid dehalogenase type II [Neoroseomonas alkaliterrae]
MSALPGVKALVFDVFGTVVDWRSGVARDARAFLVRHGRADIDPHAFADAWRRRYQPAMEEVRSGRRPFTRLDVLHRENLDAVLRDHGLDPAGIPAQELDWLNRAWHRLDPWPDTIPGLIRLRARHFLAPLSNGNILLLANMAKRAGIPWDAVLGAEVAQAYKPQPEAYIRTAEVLALAPSEMALVAAHNGDLAAARKAGLRTAFVLRPTEHGPDQTTDTRAEADWDVVAASFEDLAERLGC